MSTDEAEGVTTTRSRKRCRSRSLVRAARNKQRRLNAHTSLKADVRRQRRPSSLWEDFMQRQGWLQGQDWEACLSCLKRPLPLTFRILHKDVQREWREAILPSLRGGGGGRVWPLPGVEHAWQVSPPPQESAAAAAAAAAAWPEFRKWLTNATRTGGIARQEYVSMLPVVLLQLQPHDRVLDICASPGSKTLQALQAMGTATAKDATGLVVANDIGASRAYVLSHKCRTAADSLTRHLAVTCHNGRKFPRVSPDGGDYTAIVCDVPCSGDGTLRKDVRVWRTWQPQYGLTILHREQVQIALRSVALLTVGGRMTYSTCSFHAVENEAVVAVLLRTGAVVLRSVPRALAAAIRFRPGWTTWKVLDNELHELPRTKGGGGGYPKSLWPPRETHIQQELTKCLRLLPHDNDSGGFFIALLEKVQELPSGRRQGRRRHVAPPTRTAPQHEFHSLPKDETAQVYYYTRGGGGGGASCHDEGRRNPRYKFAMSPSLASLLFPHNGGGFEKKKKKSPFNIVYAGHKERIVEEEVT